jgi:hypothetical protein
MAAIRLSLAALGLVTALPAVAAEYRSVYTSVALDKCRELPVDPDDPVANGKWLCAGYAGMKVLVEQTDERTTVSYGENAENEIAAGETLPAFNDIGETLEWRLGRASPADGWRAFATILRFHTTSGTGAKRSTLIVTRLGAPGQVCHVGRIDAVANQDANVQARAVADDVAPRFTCGKHQALDYGLTPEGEGGE